MNKNVILLSFFVMIVGQTNESLAYSWPVDGDPNSWSYGYTFAQVVNGERHLGVDIMKDPLTPVRAPVNCKILISKTQKKNDGSIDPNGYGTYMVAEYVSPTGQKRVFGIGHMSQRSGYQAKSVGEYSEGTILGYVGYDDENGLGGPHIHWFDYGESYISFKYPGYAPNSYSTDVDYDQNGNYVGGKFTDPIKLWSSYISTILPGQYPSGTTNNPILTRYTQSVNAGHPLGSPLSNRNGGVYVHTWNGVTLQDFHGDSTGYYHGYTAIILNPNGTQAHVLKEGFWSQYMSNNGAITYGAPRSDEVPNWLDKTGVYGQAGKTYQSAQEFDLVVMLWDGSTVMVKPKTFTIAGGPDDTPPSQATPTPTHTPTPVGNIGGNHPNPQQPGFPMDYRYTGTDAPVELQSSGNVPSAIVLKGVAQRSVADNPLVQIALAPMANGMYSLYPDKRMGIYEITQEQFAAFNSAYGWFYNIDENTPVRHVTLADARAFCDWLNQYFIRCFFPGFSVG